MKKQILLASAMMLLTSGLHALTLEEQVAANTIEIGLNSTSVQELTTKERSFEQRINELENRVISLESLHNIRQFTVYGTSGLDITLAEFRAKIASLDFKSDEFLYVSGKNYIGTNGFCTSSYWAVSLLTAYANGGTSYNWNNTNPDNTWMKLPTESTWDIVSKVYVTYITGTEGLSITSYNIDVNFTQNHVYPDYYDDKSYGGEIFANDWDYKGDNSITYKVAPTRLEACGF